MTDLDLDEIEKILAEPEKKKRTRKKPDTDDRSVMGWFRLTHTAQRDCEVPQHDEESRPRNKGMVVIINDVAVCRICYLSGLDHE